MKKLFLALFVISSFFFNSALKADPIIVVNNSVGLHDFIFAEATTTNYPVDFVFEGKIMSSEEVGAKTSSKYVTDMTGWKKIHCLLDDRFLVTFEIRSSALGRELKKVENKTSLKGTYTYTAKGEEQIYVTNSKTWLDGYYTGMSINNAYHSCSSLGGKITFTVDREKGIVTIHVQNVRPYFDKPELLTMDPKLVEINFPTTYSYYDFNFLKHCKVYVPSFEGCGEAGFRILAEIENTPDNNYTTVSGVFVDGKYKHCWFEIKILDYKPVDAYIELFRKKIPAREINSAILTIGAGKDHQITQKVTGAFYIAQDLQKVDEFNYNKNDLVIEGTFDELNDDFVRF